MVKKTDGLQSAEDMIDKKIGILSMQKVMNCGSFLQAFALMNTIKELRKNSMILFIDIKPGRPLYLHDEMENRGAIKRFMKKHLPGKIKRIISNTLYFFENRDRILLYSFFWKKYLGISKENNWEETFDTVIIGSDEVFNCTQDAAWGFSKNLLGENIKSNKIITYAASCGFSTIEKAETLGIKTEACAALKNIELFSVRDKNTASFVKNFTGKDALLHLDPVFIFDYESYIRKTKEKHPFLLVYAYPGRISDGNVIEKIKFFAEKNDLNIISILGKQSWCKNIFINPFQVLSYFKSADFVVSDTFHGAVLSIKYNKQFIQFICDNEKHGLPNREKVTSLLEQFCLEDRIITNAKDILPVLEKKIAYGPINE
ncbi:MAG: polysaccharide pyruvyl transferase family protein, partial [Treponema sp.]|nr:polysaccharide pyruvyl transferase family protein [Treponema sp.]